MNQILKGWIMNRQGFDNQVNFFHGIEVEQTPMFKKPTLFVIGLQSINEITKHLLGYDHIYFGANMSFPKQPTFQEYQQWESMLLYFLQREYWCTLDIDVNGLGEFHNSSLCEYRRFIPIISVKMPYVNLFNYNTVIKIDDSDFDSTNPGVWCHRLHDLMDPAKFTDWDQYTKDQIIKN
jgi:hypothetical protein